jgi:peptide deformylase
MPGGPGRYGDTPSLPLTVFANPTIEVVDPATAGYWEGCLSVPGLRGFVERPQHVRVTYQDLDGKPHVLELKGFPATVFQHEFDHLDGVLYIDRMTDSTKLVFEDEYLKHLTTHEAQDDQLV